MNDRKKCRHDFEVATVDNVKHAMRSYFLLEQKFGQLVEFKLQRERNFVTLLEHLAEWRDLHINGISFVHNGIPVNCFSYIGLTVSEFFGRPWKPEDSMELANEQRILRNEQLPVAPFYDNGRYEFSYTRDGRLLKRLINNS